jgi:hypothetical protein
VRPQARIADVSRRGREWADRQDPGSLSGMAIGAWRRYRAVGGRCSRLCSLCTCWSSALLSLYVLVAVLPALLVMEEYLDPHPAALAHQLVHHYGLSGDTASLLRSVLVQGRAHELGSALLAVAGALFFGLGFGRVLQLVHARAWELHYRQRSRARYGRTLTSMRIRLRSMPLA